MDVKYSYYISSKGFKITEGTAAQFLKADGSVDNNSYVTTNTPQNIIAIKSFISSGGNAIANHSLRAYSTDGSKAGIALYTGGVGAGIMNYNTAGEFEFKTSDDLGYKALNSAGYKKNGFDDNSFLTAGGGSVLRSSYALATHTHTFASLTSKPTTLAGYGVTDGIAYNDTLMPTNSFGGKKLFINSIDNAMYAADKKWDVKITLHMKIHNSESYPKANPDWVEQYSLSTTDNKTFTITNNVAKPAQIVVYSGTTLCSEVSNPVGALQFTYDATTGTIVFGAVATSIQVYPEYNTPKELDSPVVQTLNAALPFNGNYENGVVAGSEHYMKVRITPKATSRTAFNQIINYPYGSLYLSYYYSLTPAKSELRVFNRNFQAHGVGWKKLNFTDYIGNNSLTANVQVVTDEGNYGRSVMEVIIHGHDLHTTNLSQIDWKLSRPDLSTTGSTVTKFGVNKLYYDLQFGDADTNKVVISPTGIVTAEKYIKSGGTAAQFLKADGSVDSNSYLTQAILNTQLANYATLNGVQTFTNTKTFLQSPVVPDATLLPHAVNFGQMSNAIEESEGNTVGYVSNNYVNTPDGFAVLLNNGTDLNANLKTGFYRGEQLVNAPNNNVGWWFITVETHDNTWVTQKAVSFGAANVGGLIYQRNLSWDGWSDWEQVWTSKQFSQTNINKWDAAIEKNVVFSTDSTLALMISDGSFNGEAGLVDSDNEVIIAGEENGYWKFATNIGDTGGILVDKNTRRMSYGNVLPSGSYKHNFGGTIFINDNITSAGGFIHNDYNDPNKILTSAGGVIDINSFGGTTIKYTEVNSGDSFTPSPDYVHHNVLARGGMKLYLDTGSGSVNGQVINLFHNISSITQVWKDGAVVATISGAKTTKFIKTSLGWQMTDVGTSTFI